MCGSIEYRSAFNYSHSTKEKRDHYFGRLFGAETLIKSGILFDARADPILWSQVVDLIVELAKRKSWLREECGWILFQAIQGSRAGNLSSEHVQTVIDRIHEKGLMESPEGVAIWIVTLEKYSTVNFPNKPWKHKNPLHRKEKASLAKIMREAPPSNIDESGHASNPSQKGTWSSKLHFAWEAILDRLLKSPSSDSKSLRQSKNQINFPDFWDECVDRKFHGRQRISCANKQQVVCSPILRQMKESIGGSCSSNACFSMYLIFQLNSFSVQI